ncbi:hypothetical protein Gasu2_00590 [Galdieria sulphuraria]|nr:hypothetical protein Gasu2_00590 [Galdieria sulphuraria]
MKGEVSSTYSSEICAICWDFPAQVELKPCCHKVICRKCICLLDDKKCPICRVEILEVHIRLHDSALSTEWFDEKLNSMYKHDCNSMYAEDLKEPENLQLLSSDDAQITFQKRSDSLYSTEACIFSLDSIIKSRRANEELVKRQVYQIVLTGSEGLDTQSLVSELKKLFPIKHNLKMLQHSSSSLYDNLQAYVNKGNIYALQGKGSFTEMKFEYLVDTRQSLEFYLPNMQVGSFPVNLRQLSIWELLCVLRSKTGGGFDIMVLCCNAMHQRSFEELLSLDELLRNRYAPGKGRIWVVLNPQEMQDSNGKNLLSFDAIEKAFYLIPMNQRPVDLLFMQTKSLCNFWHKELMHRILIHAKSYRKLTPLESKANVEKHKACCYM